MQFGGITVLLIWDSRQIFPDVRAASWSQIIVTCFWRLKLYLLFKRLRLQENMRILELCNDPHATLKFWSFHCTYCSLVKKKLSKTTRIPCHLEYLLTSTTKSTKWWKMYFLIFNSTFATYHGLFNVLFWRRKQSTRKAQQNNFIHHSTIGKKVFMHRLRRESKIERAELSRRATQLHLRYNSLPANKLLLKEGYIVMLPRNLQIKMTMLMGYAI